jgi:hypothetical protein
MGEVEGGEEGVREALAVVESVEGGGTVTVEEGDGLLLPPSMFGEEEAERDYREDCRERRSKGKERERGNGGKQGGGEWKMRIMECDGCQHANDACHCNDLRFEAMSTNDAIPFNRNRER